MMIPSVINKVKSIKELQLLTYISNVEDWKHTQESRSLLADKLSMAEITVKKSLKSLLVKGLISKVTKGIYTINKDIVQ